MTAAATTRPSVGDFILTAPGSTDIWADVVGFIDQQTVVKMRDSGDQCATITPSMLQLEPTEAFRWEREGGQLRGRIKMVRAQCWSVQ